MTWDEVLAPYRAAQIPEIVNFLIDSPYLVKIALAWQQMEKDLTDPGPELDLSKLWKLVSIDYYQLSLMTGLEAIQIMDGMEILKNNRIIFPDGSMNRYVKAYLRSQVMHKLRPKIEKAADLKEK
ncbi:MAG: hypothetical protein PHO01_12695 [Desulfotomaculaceae bacterium]|nr:hypothetical protein [Desulfotomaculaceae bacterium]